MQRIYRCYVEKRPGFDVAAKSVQTELSEVLGLRKIQVRIFNRYDLQGFVHEQWESVINTVLSEPMSDVYYEEHLPPLPAKTRLLYIEPLPGQYDVRADSCEQCIQILVSGNRPVVKTAYVYAFSGIDDLEFNRVKAYIINPLEYQEASPEKPDTLTVKNLQSPPDIPVLKGFKKTEQPDELKEKLDLAMSSDDLRLIKAYFQHEQRDPTLTELRVIDTYWSDHCRHTTFNTVINSVKIKDARVQKAFDSFLSVNGKRPVTMMGIATAAMRHFSGQGKLPMLDISEENNACTIQIKADFAHGQEDWLLFFKNETHNHPTEIEPYGGASTCIGGAIRDPLSGRAYVYQAMRITGAGDPGSPLENTLPGKLPQRKLTITAAEGFSSYGNQIGLATGYVKELYHNGYIAKRLETGAVVGAAPKSWIKRERPSPGDIVVLLGGRTGRDGIGGATGSSKTHGTDTASVCAAEVQKGNAPQERKLQRLFRNPDVTGLIKRCNDFGAGGASVAIGELAGGVEIDLDVIPVKYEGLDGTELAVSESQERMAAVVSENDLPALIRYAEMENIEATAVARVTEKQRLVMVWRGKKIVDIEREFLNTNGAERNAAVTVPMLSKKKTPSAAMTLKEKIFRLCNDLNFCSQKGLVERFDSSIGTASVFMPFGGKYALTELQVMAAMIPALKTRTASVMAYGFDPYFTEKDPFGGSAWAVLSSAAKLVASGINPDTIHLSLQEYFPRTNDDPVRWGKPFAAMLGAFSAQMGLNLAAIGGKDSMSGSYGDLDVPPTLISFAVGVCDAKELISPEFKGTENPVYLLETPMDSDGLPDYAALRNLWETYVKLCRERKVLSAWSCESSGVYGGIIKMAMGNMIGFSSIRNDSTIVNDEFFDRQWGSILFESSDKLNGFRLIGYTQKTPVLELNETVLPLKDIRSAWESPLEKVFPVKTEQSGDIPIISDTKQAVPRKGSSFAKPKAIIPVFPGTNCEYDTAAAIERAGGICEVVLIRNLTPDQLQSSVNALEKAITSAQMIVFPGGFSGGDEPDGSGKFIVSLLRNPRLTESVRELIENRDGLILGICNGFQALIKLGLLPYGQIRNMTPDCPTLTFNRIGRHQSLYVSTRVASAASPWLSKCTVGEVTVQPVSHGEGRFTASPQMLKALKANNQISFQYADHNGNPSMDISCNPNGSVWAIEGICSPDGRVLGKMAHTERYNEYTARNIPGNKVLPLFEGGIDYFK
ncbi:MAG: phosphoribosylformylglycinamidine synthase [Oscillospiraceae bacterium]|nr:phosphoribosylformylglycinamidine synthase [Oscillospiraceae bacterium]